ncbi:DNA topoisomerase [Mycoemilia scoparia]|uniref:DNA topoisomerase n=1 Tax=Mycoemilia scoparia TaxID=417184 RepID=A0A9W8DTU3_9FUNG|nr:DNA topoisomerase [Mycoemilia scoparia]
MRILCVAEKPAQARSIVEVLSRKNYRPRNGVNSYCRNFDFEYRINGNFVPVTFTSVLGHIKEIEFESDNRSWYSCDPFVLFTAPVKTMVPDRNAGVAKNIQNEARGATHLYIWTDCDREGECIGADIASVARQINPRIDVKRAHFSAITQQELDRAMCAPRLINMDEAAAVNARRELDLRIGAALTRFQTLQLKRLFSEVKDNLISYGPCQFPTLGFVVDQFLKVESFVPESFWFLHVEHENESGKTVFSWKRNKLFDSDACFAFFAKCMVDPKAHVVNVKSNPKDKWRPLPLTTVEMQKMASRYLKITPDRTMVIAEELYNKGFISYPRTETDIFDSSLNLKELVQKQVANGTWGPYAQKLINGEFKCPRPGKNNDKAHPPIHPVIHADGLSGEHAKLYEFICRRFLACCSENAKGHNTEVKIDIRGEEFTTSGLMIIARNYLDVYPYEKWNATTIPTYKLNDQFVPTLFEMRTGTTSAPKLLKDEDLVAIMEKNGIGTDATIAEHIKKVIEREYVCKKQDYLYPSTLGVALVEGYDAIGLDLSLSKPYLRREMELELMRICQGRVRDQDVKRRSIEIYKMVYQNSTREFKKIINAMTKYFGHGPDLSTNGSGGFPGGGGGGDGGGEGGGAIGGMSGFPGHTPLFKCPRCANGTLGPRQRKNKQWMAGCSTYPQCQSVIWIPDIVNDVKVSPTEICQQCSREFNDTVKKVDIKFKRGKAPPSVGQKYCGCLRGCDMFLNETFRINQALLSGHSMRTSSAPNAIPRSNSISTNFASTNQNNTFSSPQPYGRTFSNIPPQHPGIAPTPSSSSSSSTTAYRQNYGQNGKTTSNALFQSSSSFIEQMRELSENSDPSNGKPKCRCGLYANTLVVEKDGPDKGREYYKCSKQVRSCGFFRFVDGLPSKDTSKNLSNCFKCGEQGHWASACTNPQADYNSDFGGSSITRAKKPRQSAKRGRGSSRRGSTSKRRK